MHADDSDGWEPSTDRDAALRALTAVVLTVSDLLRGADDLDVRVPMLEWTIGQVALHLVSIVRAYTGAEEGSGPVGPDLTKTAENNARLIASTPERTPNGLADALDAASAAFVAANERLSRDQRVPFYGDLTITASGAARLLLRELLIHGADIAAGLGRTWSIDPNTALLALDAFPEVLPCLVKADGAQGFTATYEIRMRGAKPYFLVFENGALTVSPKPGARHVDCRISADPATYLTVTAGRASQWRAIFTGKIVTTGRRPWLANKFDKLFETP
jgi:uncharacterized protein (TIGR03083 family)